MAEMPEKTYGKYHLPAGTETEEPLAGRKNQMQEKFNDFQILHGREEKVNPKLTAYQVELAQVEAEIEKLLDTLTGYENIALALSIQNVKPKEIDSRIQEVAKRLGIEEVLNKYSYQMSGGQKQRVAAARALITNPKLILADEPTGALDSKSSRYLLESMKEMNEGLAATILMVTHDAFTASYASRVIFIKDGKIFNEIRRGDDTRKQFFNRIIEVVTVLGGSLNDAL